MGLLLNESIEQNIVFSAMQTNGRFLKKIGWFHLYDAAAAKVHATHMVETLDIRCTGIGQAAGRLSGGNQQKVCLAQALTLEPDILFVSEPTRGIDVGAKYEIYQIMIDLVKQGKSIIMISEELMELIGMCDRIIIMKDGKISGQLDRDKNLDENGLISMMV